MNATFRGALLALVCCLLCASLVYAAPAPPNQLLTCRPTAGGLSGATQTYNNCSHICCVTGAVPYTDSLSGCCHDSATSCPMGMSCCTPSPAVTDPLLQTSRPCYSPTTQGCCQWKYSSGWSTGDLPTYVSSIQTYYTASQQCCATTGNGWFSHSSQMPIVSKSAGSCVNALQKTGYTFRCLANSDCPGTGNYCCRRPQQATETTTAMYNQQGFGTCYDPKFQSCCGGSLQIGEKGNKYGDQYNFNATWAPAVTYNPYTKVCCALPISAGGAISFVADIGNDASKACPCLANTDCPSSDYTCCQPSEAEMSAAGSSIKRIIKCDAGCPTSNVTQPGSGEFMPACYGKCIRSSMSFQDDKQVCVTGTFLGGRCDNMRVPSGTQFNVPTISDLIKNDTVVHNWDCCPYTVDGTVAFSVLYNTKTQACCPATGTAVSGTRFYTPVVSTQQSLDTAADRSSLATCVCNSDSDCPTGQSCCLDANTLLNAGQQAYSGLCFDSKKHSCCKWSMGMNWPVAELYDFRTQQCCKNGLKQQKDGWGTPQFCSCHTDSDCSTNGENTQCCSSAITLGTDKTSHTYGRCINPNKQGCCDYKWNSSPVPDVYDKEKMVCCPLNGVTDAYYGCSCGADSDCPTSGACCLDAQYSGPTDCAIGFNCPGTCAHTKIQTCCDDPNTSEFDVGNNVKRCNAEYQKCCNGECCNKAYQTCKKTTIRMTDEYHQQWEKETKKCTTKEHSSPSIVFHTWVFPAFLSIACFVFLAISTKTALGTDISPNLIKLGLVGLSIFVGIMSILLLWSPLWKYGFVIVIANTIILVSFSVAGVWTRRFAVFVAVVSFLWIVEPFGTNYIWSFGNSQFNGISSEGLSVHGLNYAARLLLRKRTQVSGDDVCTRFYQYWLVDENLRDTRSWNSAGYTYGICRRSWMHTITVLAGLITPFQTIFLLMAGLAIARATEVTKDHNSKIQPLA